MGFYLSALAVLLEVRINVSQEDKKWTPYSGVLFEDTVGCLPTESSDDVTGLI